MGGIIRENKYRKFRRWVKKCKHPAGWVWMKWNPLRLRSQRFPLQAKQRGRDVLNGKAPGEIAGDANKPATKFRKRGLSVRQEIHIDRQECLNPSLESSILAWSSDWQPAWLSKKKSLWERSYLALDSSHRHKEQGYERVCLKSGRAHAAAQH